jgi:hypothetical protein
MQAGAKETEKDKEKSEKDKEEKIGRARAMPKVAVLKH